MKNRVPLLISCGDPIWISNTEIKKRIKKGLMLSYIFGPRFGEDLIFSEKIIGRLLRIDDDASGSKLETTQN